MIPYNYTFFKKKNISLIYLNYTVLYKYFLPIVKSSIRNGYNFHNFHVRGNTFPFPVSCSNNDFLTNENQKKKEVKITKEKKVYLQLCTC